MKALYQSCWHFYVLCFLFLRIKQILLQLSFIFLNVISKSRKKALDSLPNCIHFNRVVFIEEMEVLLWFQLFLIKCVHCFKTKSKNTNKIIRNRQFCNYFKYFMEFLKYLRWKCVFIYILLSMIFTCYLVINSLNNIFLNVV